MEVNVVTVACAVGSVVMAVMFAYLLLVYYNYKKYAHVPGPPRASYFAGNVPQMTKHTRSGQYIGNLFYKWFEEYGPIFVVYIYFKPLVVVGGKEAVKKITYDVDHFPKTASLYSRVAYIFGQRAMGRGLVTVADQSIWHSKRKVMNPAFHRKYLMGMMDNFNDVVDRLLDRLRPYADGRSVVDMLDYSSRLTLDIIAEVGFDLRPDSINDPDCIFAGAITLLHKGMVASTSLPFFAQNCENTRELRRNSIEAIKSLRKTAGDLYEARKEAVSNGEDVPHDMLTMVVKNAIQDESITLEDIKDEFITFFVAGQETTAKQLSFLIRELTKRRDIYEKCRAEVLEIMGSSRHVAYEDLSKLNYCNATLKETLRLYPPVTTVARENVHRPCEFYGMKIPKATTFLVNLFSAHRLPATFENPLEFRPERWLNVSDDSQLFAAFSLGPRSCIGQVFAQIEARVFMMKFIQTFRMIPGPGMTDEVEEIATLRPRGGVPVKLIPADE